MNELKDKIENNTATKEDIFEIIAKLDAGSLRVAEKKDGTWIVNTWVKEAVIKYFGYTENTDMSLGDFVFKDKIPLKNKFENVRIVPGGNSIRYGSYLSDNVIMMPPSYVNIGAYVGKGTMIDSNVLVGSCAQIGEKVHLSAGVQIGGVLEPSNAQPVIIEDNAFIGAGVIVVEGVLVSKNAVLAPGVVISASTRILEINKER
ncbi:MAG: 2,3,4,5-tetrahydropyridine-2,6-dicarboxylate N-succinyltransferase [Saprospiraceae bacterium]